MAPASGELASRGFVAALVVGVAVTTTANNFAGRIKAMIMGNYNFVTVVPDSILQLLFYSAALAVQYWRGRVDKTQLNYLFGCARRFGQCSGWIFLVGASINDVAGQVTGLASQPYLTTFMMSLMDQATTPFTVVFSMLLLGIRYIPLEWAGIVVIVCAAVACAIIANHDNDADNSEFWAIFAAVTTCFAALSFVLKEMTFQGYRRYRFCDSSLSGRTIQLPVPDPTLQSATASAPLGAEVAHSDMSAPLQSRSSEEGSSDPGSFVEVSAPSLNIFLVSAFINFIGVLVSIPIALLNYSAVSKGSSDEPAWAALCHGLRNIWEKDDALTAYLVYLCTNTIFNLTLITATNYGSALLCFLSLKAGVPLTAILSALPWPVIGAKPLDTAEWVALAFVVAGLIAFRTGNIKRFRLEAACVEEGHYVRLPPALAASQFGPVLVASPMPAWVTVESHDPDKHNHGGDS